MPGTSPEKRTTSSDCTCGNPLTRAMPWAMEMISPYSCKAGQDFSLFRGAIDCAQCFLENRVQ